MEKQKMESYYHILKRYADGDMYPLHMPGHKRRSFSEVLEELQRFMCQRAVMTEKKSDVKEVALVNVCEQEDALKGLEKSFKDQEKASLEDALQGFLQKKETWSEPVLLDGVMTLDVTEISDLDDLHHATDALKASMEQVAQEYGAAKSFYVINGSTCGNLAALEAVTNFGDEVLIARNCHKSVYNELIHRGLRPHYVYPQYVDDLGISGSVLPQDVEKILQNNPNIKAVMVVSPTYDGVVSDIKGIAQVVHAYGIPLIVDEAHGAHFFSESIHLGADLVIQSLHKTLPSLTQTALLHVRDEYVSIRRVEEALQYFQSTSPSYLLVASIDTCMEFCRHFKRELMDLFEEKLRYLYKSCEKLREIYIYPYQFPENYGIFKRDASKVLIASRHGVADGTEIAAFLHDEGHLELEMTAQNYGLALLSPFDSWEGLQRLVSCLERLDEKILERYQRQGAAQSATKGYQKALPTQVMTPYEAKCREVLEVLWEEAAGFVAADLLYVYPPGIPLLVPGERVDKTILELGNAFRGRGLVLRGLSEKDELSVIREDDTTF